MKRLWLTLLFVLVPVMVGAQTLPQTVKIGIDPPTDAPTGYNVAQDGGAVTFVPLPPTQTCNDFFTNAAAPCVAFSFTFTTAGVHSVSIAAVSVGGTSTAAGISFNLTVPGAALHPRVVAAGTPTPSRELLPLPVYVDWP